MAQRNTVPTENSIWPASFQPSHRMPERYLSQHFVQHCIGVFPQEMAQRNTVPTEPVEKLRYNAEQSVDSGTVQAYDVLCCVGPSLPIILYVAAPLGGFDGEFGRIGNSLNSEFMLGDAMIPTL
jgi:hypothetical protein